jgi:alpha-galactosidase
MKNRFRLSVAAVFLAALTISSTLRGEETVSLSTLDLSKVKQGCGEPQIDKAVGGEPLMIGGETFEHGMGTHANSVFYVALGGGTSRFTAYVGMDGNEIVCDPKAGPAVKFLVFGDGKTLFQSGVMKRVDKAKKVDIDLRGIKTLALVVRSANVRGVSGDSADWADATFYVTGEKPKAIAPPREEFVRLTPSLPREPCINGPVIYGCRPEHPFIYRIPTTGERPMKFSADNLPPTLKLDAAQGIITGNNPPRGEYAITFHAENRHGKAEKKFKLVSGDKLCLTPPMGWNDWYTYTNKVTDRVIREAADTMVRNGMADVGYQYVSIDDCWMNAPENSNRPENASRRGPLRDENGNILPNKFFPDMKAMTDHIHARGLKAGIYTSPGRLTCAGYGASYQHEEQDARQFADWGFDMLKYDWCSYCAICGRNRSVENVKKPYAFMGEILKRQNRDIHFNYSLAGIAKVWTWGEQAGGQSWRTAGDLGFQLDRFIDVAIKNAEHWKWSKPGAWNDPDYLQIGYLDEPSSLTPNEQYSFVSLWCLMASPLFFSGDLQKADDFTLGLLCNTEVLDVDQDPLGQCAHTVFLSDEAVLFVKDMEDGSKAVGMVNRGEMEIDITAKWSDLGLKGRQRVRDLWRQKDLGEFDDSFTTKVGRHGTFLIRLWPIEK